MTLRLPITALSSLVAVFLCLESVIASGDDRAPLSEIATPAAQARNDEYHKYAVIRGLNKVTGKSLTLKVAVGDELHYFGRLGFFVRKCWQDSEADIPESKVLLEVWEKDKSGDAARVFYGWLFSRHPSVSALEHSTYDLSLVECASHY